MLIVPNTENWNEGEFDWSFVPDPKSEIVNWEKRTGIKLPKEYRNFLFTYNGGSVYPRIFKHSISPSTLPSISPEEMVGNFYRWDQVLARFNGEIYGKGIPGGYLNIGDTPGPLELLIGIEGENEGQIYAWLRSSSPWGSGSNKEIHLLSASFPLFLKMLYDDEEKTDYEGWFIPAFETVSRELEIDLM
jgi:hypothetical protein